MDQGVAAPPQEAGTNPQDLPLTLFMDDLLQAYQTQDWKEQKHHVSDQRNLQPKQDEYIQFRNYVSTVPGRMSPPRQPTSHDLYHPQIPITSSYRNHSPY